MRTLVDVQTYGHPLLFALNRTPRPVRRLSSALTLIAHPNVQLGFAAAAAVVLGRRAGMRVLGATLLARLGAVAIGRAFPRPRPWLELPAVRVTGPLNGKPSFPSKHAATSFGLAVALGAVVPSWRKAALALASAVTLARVAQGQHYPSDALAGAALGASTAAALGAVL